ncbi:hypothetical protein DBV39_04880 [Orrella marina]|uniref:Uncharacterized protein n=1 Tax=Orrella marina TaxID=2163011 RepID=A0A2R4XH66_9BURK|nr:hypothetical protein DBV39_04880 [Orrella marina]
MFPVTGRRHPRAQVGCVITLVGQRPNWRDTLSIKHYVESEEHVMPEQNKVVNEVELFYQMKGTGPALLLLHGLSQNRSIWWRVCDQ